MSIDPALVRKHAPTEVNKQVHVNHDGCSSGTDRKKRLYIKRTETGLLAYCHHCSEKAFIRDDEGRLRSFAGTSTAVSTSSKYMPTAVLVDELSLDARVWLMKHFCHSSELFKGVKGKTDQVALLLHDYNADVVGYQIRNLKSGTVPKYLTVFNQTAAGRIDSSWFRNQDNSTLVITEDYLSAYRVHKETGYNTLALLRTTVSDKTLAAISSLGFTHIYLWLDPDSAGIKGATSAYKLLKYYLPNHTVITKLSHSCEAKQCKEGSLLSFFTATEKE